MNMCIGMNSYPRVSQTMASPVLLNIMEITPSILTADFCKLGETLDEAVKAGVEWFHMDIMDGNWVINKTITFGPAIIKSVRDFLGDEAFIDCHLMITNAELTWKQYIDAGADMIICHVEAVNNFQNLINEAHSYGAKVGCVLNPETDIAEVLPLLPNLDLVLVMSVVPGKGGQSFMPSVEHKVREFRRIIDLQIKDGGKKTKLMIDGGIKHHNADLVSSWGVDIAVVGSGLINTKGSIDENLTQIKKSIKT